MLRDLSLAERIPETVGTAPLILAAPSRTAAIESDAADQCSSDISDYILSMASGSTFAIGTAHSAIQSESARKRARCLSATDSSSRPLGLADAVSPWGYQYLHGQNTRQRSGMAQEMYGSKCISDISGLNIVTDAYDAGPRSPRHHQRRFFPLLPSTRHRPCYIIPLNLPDGQYLVGLENIALHLAGTWRHRVLHILCPDQRCRRTSGPQPKAAFPGAYTGYEHGILINIYPPYPAMYEMSGPDI
ncbi:lytic polysaccharide monooxygenase [Sphaerobolus stellatus SS14]|uniref:AA9 family lytic polysaccharide monooxygenase n=1 Tax=Sphaerobolus stellatus (strain SS14) TaxID=990650 RepID=A0A0C9UYR6_SPHS4|nr:lytic polysaccharide monooxygenase [Sphaerobolus stellatus SS14]